jgi:1,2-phenylacetyl-CoA epoxidase catalytic subunit
MSVAATERSRLAAEAAEAAVKLLGMERAQVTHDAVDAQQPDRNAVFRYYELAKRAEWQVRDLPWDEQPPIPETRGSAEKQARRRDIWRSVIMQQLQADTFAVQMAGQLLAGAPHFEAKLYYSTMAQDEARHTEAWLKLAEIAGGEGERDPYLDKLAEMFLALDTLEEKVFLMQVFFERLIIPRFRMIAAASRGTVLEDLCNRLTVDDGIHHRSGVAYERVLLERATKEQKQQLVKVANLMMPIFVDHAMWRPKARAFIGSLMQKRDAEMLRDDLTEGIRLASSLGIDVSEVELPAFN